VTAGGLFVFVFVCLLCESYGFTCVCVLSDIGWFVCVCLRVV
jgi:hypothetical protein